MYKIITLLSACFLIITGACYGQKDALINQSDAKGLKQGIWMKKYNDGSIRYEGKFENDIPVGVFKYYYEDGKKISSVLEYYNKGTQANAKIYHLNGKLMGEGKYLNQKKDSSWKYYDQGENLISEEFYLKNKKNGRWTVYYKEGKLASEKNWSNDLEQGEWKEYFETGKLKIQAFYKDGNLEGKVINYFPNGLKMQEGNYQSSLKNGDWISYNEDGTLKMKENYKNGFVQKTTKMNGEFTEYFIDGIPKEIFNFKNGKKNGAFKIYHETGKWVREVKNQGTPQEEVEEYIDGQTIKTEGKYIDDKLEGRIKYFKTDGSLEKEENYLNGVLMPAENKF